MSDYRKLFRAPEGWMEVRRDGLWVMVLHHPVIRRTGLRFEVFDWRGGLVDSFDASDATPGPDPVELSRFEAADAYERAEWLAQHLEAGVLTLASDMNDLPSIPLSPVIGGLYATPEGVRGILMRDDDGYYLDGRAEPLPVEEDELRLLVPVAGPARFVEASEVP